MAHLHVSDLLVARLEVQHTRLDFLGVLTGAVKAPIDSIPGVAPAILRHIAVVVCSRPNLTLSRLSGTLLSVWVY